MAERRHRGGPLVRRARSQWRLLTAVLAVMVVGATLTGACALLVGTGRWQALEAAAQRFDGERDGGDRVTVTAGIGGTSTTSPPRSSDLLDVMLPALDEAVGPFDATVSTWVASPRLRLPGSVVQHTYLLDADTAADHATLVTGRWPVAQPGAGAGLGAGSGADAGEPLEVAVPRVTAAPLGIGVGDIVALTATEGLDQHSVRARVVVVGLVDLDSSPTWQRDPLRGAGVDSGGRVAVLGPLLTAPGVLVDARATAGRVAVEADVDPTGHAHGLEALAQRVDGLRGVVQTGLTTGGVPVADYVTVRSGLSGFVADARTQLALTAGLVLAVVALVLVLTSAALTLVVRATLAARAVETALVSDRGAGRARLLAWAVGENLGLGVLATALAVPLALLGYRVLTSAGPLGEAWRTVRPVEAPGELGLVVLAVGAAVLVQAGVAVVVAVRGSAARTGRFAHGGLARSGADLLLAALGVLAFLQLRAHRPSASAVDPVLVLAPALCVTAAAVLALRVLPLVVRLSERVARRSSGLVVPLAGWHVARGRATTGMLLAVLTTASSALAVAAEATWDVAQHQQAQASLAADVRVPADGAADQGQSIRAAARRLDPGAEVLPVIDRTVSLGSRPGGAVLVATDTLRAGDVVRSPVAGGWQRATRALAPEVPAVPLVVDAAPLTVVVDVTSGGEAPGLAVAPTLVLQDELGRRTSLVLDRVVADAGPARLRVPAAGEPDLPPGRWRVLAVSLAVSAPSSDPLGVSTALTVDVQVVGATAAAAGSGDGGDTVDATGADDAGGGWSANGDGELVMGHPDLTRTGDRLTVEADISLLGLSYAGATVLLSSFPLPEELPVLVSAVLADELALAAGDVVDLGIGTSFVPATVAGELPYVPGRPRDAAVLVDDDALARSLMAVDDLEPKTDAWWVATAHPVALAAEVGGRASGELGDQLAAGPLRAAAGAALAVLVIAAVLLAVAGAFARERAAAPERGLEVARLRGIGASRRAVLATSLLRHVLVTTTAVGLGALVGGLLAWSVAPALVVSGDGGTLVPPPVGVWPWPVELAVLGTLLVGSVLAGVPVARQVVARSTASVLRGGDAP